jgi:hypothetical protein
MATVYAVRNIGSREIISWWTPEKAQADEWAAEGELHETEPLVEVIDREVTDWEALNYWLNIHCYERMTPELAATCPACEGWYPIVDADGDLTGDLAAADDLRYELLSDALGCVRLREGKS